MAESAAGKATGTGQGLASPAACTEGRGLLRWLLGAADTLGVEPARGPPEGTGWPWVSVPLSSPSHSNAATLLAYCINLVLLIPFLA